MPVSNGRWRLSAWRFVRAADMPVACLITYWIITFGLAHWVDRPSDLLGGMWAVIATIFVFRDTGADTISAGMARLIATCVSFAVCLPYLLLFPANSVGLAILLAIGSLIIIGLSRHDDIITTGITTTVVIVVAEISPQDAWQQPLLRLVDTVTGIAVGVACKWLTSRLYDELKVERSP